ncbi:hypothetical protein Nepgr_033109 [Nepenthes gracilis]|uniref:Uncharacterized protein n=1 Tax=Nepenthes gracilis TaxID=150966 RepID=A0AAD3TLI1_NEPGR|nr:hypothetical protein Nepgr_033109 [Nepenthes gracilis]
MGTVAEPSSERSETPPSSYYFIEKALKSLEETNPWIESALQRARLAQKTLEVTVESAIAATGSRVSQIRLTSSAHFYQTIESLKDIKGQYDAYEDKLFGKIKEGSLVAASYPLATSTVAFALGFLVLKEPRRFLYHKTLRLFMSEEALLARADAKVKELRLTFERLKAESEKLEKRATIAEEEMKRGSTKLRHAGNQIQKVILSADKIQRQASGLKDALRELPSGEASYFRSQVSKLASEAKREQNVLAKEVSKISNYGISV